MGNPAGSAARVAGSLTLGVALTACALSPWDNEKAPGGFQDGTLVLAELHAAFSRQEVVTACVNNDGFLCGFREKLTSLGYADADIVDGSTVSTDVYCYGHNSSVGCRAHLGAYIAHVPGELRGSLTTKYVSERDTLRATRDHGDLVVLELKKTASGHLAGTVVGVHRPWNDWRDCSVAKTDYGLLYAISPYGPPVGLWIECADAEHEGWLRREVRGAPPHDPPISEWVKLPVPARSASGANP